MATPSPAQRITDLTERVRTLEAEFAVSKQVNEIMLKALQDQAAERAKGEEELKNKVSELAAKNAALEERARYHDKMSDRGFSTGQAAIVAMISILGGALLSLLIQLAIKK